MQCVDNINEFEMLSYKINLINKTTRHNKQIIGLIKYLTYDLTFSLSMEISIINGTI